MKTIIIGGVAGGASAAARLRRLDEKAEILLLSSSMRVPSLQHNGVTVWDTMAIGEYLNEIKPKAGLLPAEIKARAHCRAVCGEMHSGFNALRSSLPMNIKAHHPGFKVWSRAQLDIDRVLDIMLSGEPPGPPPKARTLLIWGEADRSPVFDKRGARKMRQSLAESKLVTLPEAGHLPQVERPAEFRQALRNFLKA